MIKISYFVVKNLTLTCDDYFLQVYRIVFERHQRVRQLIADLSSVWPGIRYRGNNVRLDVKLVLLRLYEIT